MANMEEEDIEVVVSVREVFSGSGEDINQLYDADAASSDDDDISATNGNIGMFSVSNMNKKKCIMYSTIVAMFVAIIVVVTALAADNDAKSGLRLSLGLGPAWPANLFSASIGALAELESTTSKVRSLAKPVEPFIGKVVSTKRIVGPKATGETCHIIIDHNGDFPYIEGQFLGIIPPGVNEKNGQPHAARLYSIASSRFGDDMTGKTLSLTVRRATYWDPELDAEDPAKKGICSNFLCDTQPGNEVMMTGPFGEDMIFPEEDPYTDYIMVAAGTGIAPFRGFIRRLFFEDNLFSRAYKGQAWLFLGVANSDALLYDDEFQDAKARFPDNFRLDYALSREQKRINGRKMMYIQEKVEEYADEIFAKLENGAHIYMSGLKGMMPGILNMFAEVCKSKGIHYNKFMKGLEKNGQWHVEVY